MLYMSITYTKPKGGLTAPHALAHAHALALARAQVGWLHVLSQEIIQGP
jgi:hypothetical protein